MYSLTSLIINDLFKEIQHSSSPQIYRHPNGHTCKVMSFNIDLILGVKTALNENTHLYELLFEAVLNAPLKYCSIWESDIAHKTLMNHKMFVDICHELHTKKNIPLLRENIMNGRISKLELNAFRNSRVKQLKKNWTLIAQEIIAKQECIQQKNMHKKKNKTHRRVKNNSRKKKKKMRKADIDEDYIYTGGEYKFKKHKKRQKMKKNALNRNMSNSNRKADKKNDRKKRKRRKMNKVENMDKILKNKTLPVHKKRRLNTNNNQSVVKFSPNFPIPPLPFMVDNQAIVSGANDAISNINENTISHPESVQKNPEKKSQILIDLEKMLLPVIVDLPIVNNNHPNQNQTSKEHAFIPVAPVNYSLLNSSLNINNQQISMSLKELENNLNLNRKEIFNDNDTKVDEKNTNKHEINVIQNGNKVSVIDIHMYKNVPLSVTLLRKQKMVDWKKEEQKFLAQTKNRNAMLFLHLSASLISIQKLICDLQSEAQMIFDQKSEFKQKLVECKKQYLQWKADWTAKKAELKIKLLECENGRKQALEKMVKCKQRIRGILEIVKADDAEGMSNETAKDIHYKLEEGMENIHEIQNVQKTIVSQVEFYQKTDKIFDESFAENTAEYERFCHKMQFVGKYGKKLLTKKQEMLEKSLMLENSYLLTITAQNN